MTLIAAEHLAACLPDFQDTPLSQIPSTEAGVVVSRLVGDQNRVGVAAFQASI